MDDLRRRLMFSEGGGGGLLPKEYQQVEYLQSTGTQYILPGFTPQDDTGVNVDFKYNVSASGNNIIVLLGAQNTSGISNYWDINDTPYSTNYINFEMNYSSSSGYGTAVSLVGSHSQSKHNAKINYCNSGAIYLDDVSKGAYTHSRAAGPTNYPMVLFADNLNGTVSRFFQGNIYHVAFSEGANVIRDMYPCYRKSDGVVGMYDTVTKTFFTNQGTGEFICGRSIVTDDARFTQVLAIQSSGTQYIDTDVKMNGTYTTNALFKTITISSSETFKVFGGRDNSNFYTFGMYSSGHTSAPTTCGYGGSDYWSSSLVSNTDYNLLFTSTGAKLNGTSVGTWSSQSFSSNVTFYLFGTSYNSTASQLASIAMSCFRIKPSAYTRDFIPCVLEQTVTDYWGNSQEKGAVGMWDLISDKFFPNNGSGAFAIIGGYNVPTDGLIAEYLFNDNTNDTSGNGKTLTNGKSVSASSNPPSFVNASPLTFEGSNTAGLGLCANHAFGTSAGILDALLPLNSPLSVSFWLKSSSTEASVYMIMFGRVYNDCGMNITLSNGKVAVGKGLNAATWSVDSLLSTSTVNDNIWHHVALTWDGTTASNSFKLYIDGDFEAAMTPSVALTFIQPMFQLSYESASSPSSAVYVGYLDNIRVYNRELTASEVTMLYNEVGD